MSDQTTTRTALVPPPVGGLSVRSAKGKDFNIRIVRRGDRYGRNHVLVHEDKIKYGPMIEFYNAAVDGHDTFGWGVLVSSYYVSTLYEVTNGLCLDGAYREFDVDADTLNLIQSWLRNQLNSNGGENASTCSPHPQLGQSENRPDPG